MVSTNKGMLFYPTPKIHYVNGFSKSLGGRCNNACERLQHGHNYINASWCRECRVFILNTDLQESKAGVKICPCCHASVRRKTRYNKTRQDQYRKICLKPLEDNTILGMRACKRCGTKFPRTLHTGNRKFCGGCKK